MQGKRTELLMNESTATELIEFRADQMIQAVLNEREVYRVDDKPNVQFKPKEYWHNKDWTDSGAGKTGPSGTKNTKAIFALPRKKDAAFYTAPRDIPRASIRKPDGSQHILFQQSDRERVAGNRPTLSTFSRKPFRKAGQSGELITRKTVKPTSRETIKDPIGFMKKHGRVAFVKDLGKTVSDLRGRGKIVDTENLPNKTESLTKRLPNSTELIEAKLRYNVTEGDVVRLPSAASDDEYQSSDCDSCAGERTKVGPIHRLETGGGSGVHLCRPCWGNEMEWRERRNQEMLNPSPKTPAERQQDLKLFKGNELALKRMENLWKGIKSNMRPNLFPIEPFPGELGKKK